MAIAQTVADYLEERQVPFQVVAHPRTASSLQSAHAAHVPSDWLAKAVMLEDPSGYLMAVIPAACHIKLGILRQELGRPLGLATEGEVAKLFSDCALGAVPALGPAYGIETIVDESLLHGDDDIYLEAGDHEELLRVAPVQFARLFEPCWRGRFCEVI